MFCQNDKQAVIIYPLIFYHGSGDLQQSQGLFAQLALEDPMMSLVLEKGVQVVDMRKQDKLVGSIEPGAVLGQILKMAREAPSLEKIEAFMPVLLKLHSSHRNLSELMLEYLLRCGAYDEHDLSHIIQVRQKLLVGETGEADMMTIADALESIGEQRGFEKGIEKGVMKGVAKGKRLMRNAAERLVQRKQIQVIQRMLKQGASVEMVAQAFELSEADVKMIKKMFLRLLHKLLVALYSCRERNLC